MVWREGGRWRGEGMKMVGVEGGKGWKVGRDTARQGEEARKQGDVRRKEEKEKEEGRTEEEEWTMKGCRKRG